LLSLFWELSGLMSVDLLAACEFAGCVCRYAR
jgi:hypothetical protein